MANLSEVPQKMDVRALARYVRELQTEVRALRAMTVSINRLPVNVNVYANDGTLLGTGSGIAQGFGKLAGDGSGSYKLVIG